MKISEERITQDVREKIIESARELFIQKGFNGTSVRDIATASDTNVAMVNYYFRSKYNLFADIFNEAFNIVTGKLFILLDSDMPFFEMLRKWIYTYFEVLGQYPGFPLFVLNELSQHPETLKESFDLSNPNHIFNKVEKRLNEEMAKGTIPPMDILDFMMNLVSLCLFPFVFSPVARTLLNVDKERYEQFLDSHKEFVADFVIKAIKNEDK